MNFGYAVDSRAKTPQYLDLLYLHGPFAPVVVQRIFDLNLQGAAHRGCRDFLCHMFCGYTPAPPLVLILLLHNIDFPNLLHYLLISQLQLILSFLELSL